MTEPYAIFIDAQVFEAESFNFKSQRFAAIEALIKKDSLALILTDITVREVRSRIQRTVTEQLAPIEKFKKQARVLRSSSLAAVAAALGLDPALVVEDLLNQFDEFLKRTNVQIIDTSALPAGPVFEKYFAGKAPFGTGDKKAEFPDAFVVEALVRWSKENEAPINVVSGDKGFLQACREQELDTFELIGHLLNAVNNDLFTRAVADFVRDETKLRLEDIKEQIKHQFEDNIYSIDDEWGDVEVTLNELEPDGEPDILDIEPESATLEVRLIGNFTAHLSYEDSSTGTYDSETKGVFGMEWRHEERDETEEFVAQVKVRFEPFDPDKFEIEEVDLIQPNDSFTVSTSKWAGYPWK